MNIVTEFPRRQSRRIYVGDVAIGDGSPISVQTMTKTKTADVKSTIEQIARCKDTGADIVRVTVNDKDAAEAIGAIIKKSDVPLVADIHFNHIFALKSIDAGIAKVRINPGNIGSKERVKEVLTKAKEHSVPIRIGVNSGSLENDLLDKYGYPTAAQDSGFDDIAISVKSTSVPLMIEAYRLIAAKTDFPLHLGVTEAGTAKMGTIKSAVGIGTLLAEGIGDTIRVSLTEEPELEVQVGKDVLRSLRLAQRGLEIIACPTCGRLEVDLFKITRALEEKLTGINKNLTIAILGCVVNGPGEAKEADIGIAAGKGVGMLYRKGKFVRKIKEEDIVEEVYKEVMQFQQGRS